MLPSDCLPRPGCPDWLWSFVEKPKGDRLALGVGACTHSLSDTSAKLV